MPESPAVDRTDSSPAARQAAALARLRALLVERAERGEAIAGAHESEVAKAQDEFDTATSSAEAEWSAAKRRAEEEAQSSHAKAKAAFDTQSSAEARRHRNERSKHESMLADREDDANRALTDAEAIADTSFEPAVKAEDDAVRRLQGEVRAIRESAEMLEAQAVRLAGPRVRIPPTAPMILGQTRDGDLALPPEWREHDGPPPLEAALAKREEVERSVRRLGGITLHAMFRAGVPILLGFLAFLGGVFGGAIRTGWTEWTTPLLWAGGGVAAVLLISWPLRALAFRGTRKRVEPIARDLRELRHLCDVSIAMAQESRRNARQRLVDARDAELNAAKAIAQKELAQVRAERTKVLGEIDARYRSVSGQLITAREQAQERAERARAEAIEAADKVYEEATRESRATLDAERAAADGRRAEAARELAERFVAEAHELKERLDRIREEARAGAAPWDDESWSLWSPPRSASAGVPIAWTKLSLSDLPSGLPSEPDEREGLAAPLDLPALIGFPGDASLLVRAGASERSAALDVLRNSVLRLLTSLPPGKVRLTMFDPVGLGQSFAGFMRLSDHDDRLVTSRIWTEAKHLEQRLSDLTEHMETVIQKYLRNEFESIEAYNTAAGEIAEPYRFLVIADLPEGLTEEAGRRLASVIESGPRCGVYTLIHVDPDRPLPETIDAETLERASCVVSFAEDGRAVVAGEAYEGLAFDVERPPPEAESAKLLDQVGREGLDAGRVEVPFRLLGPPEGELWSADCADELRVPLGRAGATRYQELALGKGTSQHVLIAGKTGSGKSTLLHVLIANAARWLSPDQVEMYLVDFKKGVEFKAYAEERLPHARVVAVESDREFGLSVLKRLDEELKRRGDLFRELGAQSIAAARSRVGEAGRDERLPRVLLIIDEFQEFFTEDDQIAQEASLLLDRLVRQGRAFGMHVLLGSQTLSGAYSLARSTVGQMAVRIALQCSETDSYLILSEDNGAARLLNRPGEAIYNDANGLAEGNSPFQVAWLSDEQRDETLDRVRERASAAGWERGVPQIVFEGNAPSGVERNHRLLEALESPPAAPVRAAKAWLGEPVAIKDHTAVRFQRQHGANGLIVGQQPDAARAMLAAATLGLAAQHAADPGSSLVIIDGTPPDEVEAGLLGEIARSVSSASGPDIRCVGPREAEGVIAELAAECAERDAASRTDAPARYLVINGLQRIKALRKGDDDFSFSFSSDDEGHGGTSAADSFATILRDGPALGLFTLAWCDSLAGLNRTLDRRAISTFEQRVVTQMSAADSSSLIDSGAAAKLGLNRALLYDEELGTLEKFRPYAAPPGGFAASVAARIASNAGG